MNTMNWLVENKEWIFSGIGVAIIGLIIQYIISKNKTSNFNKNAFTNSNKSDIDINVNVINGTNTYQSDNNNTNKKHEGKKEKIRILFIDDDTKFKIVKILNKIGWQTKIVKDIDNLDSDIVKNSHIFFVDINDVGLKLDFKDQGLGLASAIKKKYPEKRVVIYSSETKGDRFHKALREVDDFLQKNAEPFEFQQIIENFANELNI